MLLSRSLFSNDCLTSIDHFLHTLWALLYICRGITRVTNRHIQPVKQFLFTLYVTSPLQSLTYAPGYIVSIHSSAEHLPPCHSLYSFRLVSCFRRSKSLRSCVLSMCTSRRLRAIHLTLGHGCVIQRACFISHNARHCVDQRHVARGSHARHLRKDGRIEPHRVVRVPQTVQAFAAVGKGKDAEQVRQGHAGRS